MGADFEGPLLLIQIFNSKRKQGKINTQKNGICDMTHT